VLAAEIGCLSIAFGVESCGGVDGHAADGIDCFGSGCIHGLIFFFVVMELGVLRSRFSGHGGDGCAGASESDQVSPGTPNVQTSQ
jgi:hypothetical protein